MQAVLLSEGWRAGVNSLGRQRGLACQGASRRGEVTLAAGHQRPCKHQMIPVTWGGSSGAATDSPCAHAIPL